MKTAPKLALLEVEYLYDHWILHHPECQEFHIDSKYLEFDETKKTTAYMNEAELNLLHVSDKACDDWFTKVCKYVHA